MSENFNVSEVLSKIDFDDISIENKVRCALFLSKNQSEKYDLLMELIQSIPVTLWLELAIGCINEVPVNDRKNLCEQINAIFNENKKFSKSDSIKIFKQIEEKAVSLGLCETHLSKLVPHAASFLNRFINDNHYKLFADYGYVYHTSDIEKLKTAVVELNNRYENGGSPEIVRWYAYLLTIAQLRLSRLLYPKDTITPNTLSNAYSECFEKDDGYLDCGKCYDDGWQPVNSDVDIFHNISSVPKRITNSGCIEIARIFDPHIYYINADLLCEIHTAVKEVSERDKYEDDTDLIIEKAVILS